MSELRCRGGVLSPWLMAFAFSTALAAEPAALPTGEPLAVDATALVPLDVETAVSIRGIRGQITISGISERELRVVSRQPGPTGAELPVGIWQSGTKLIVAPAPGNDGGERQLFVELPRSLAIALDADGSDVSVQAPGGAVEVRGKNSRVVVAGSTGTLYVDLEGGTLTVVDSQDLTARVRGTVTRISEMPGNVNVRATAGSLALGTIAGSIDVETDDTKIVAEGPTGPMRIKARKGDAALSAFKGGADLQLSGTPLHLKDGKGDVSVVSDATVEFQMMAASLHFDMYGGSLRGKGNQGILEVRTRNTEVTLETIEQGMRIQGDGLRAHLEDIGGELYIETSISDVVADRVGSVILRLDRGTATVQRAGGPVEALVTGGDVKILDASGPVNLDADRGDAIVSFASISGDKDSKLVNKGGAITARFPASASCRVEAKSKDGRVDSSLPTVKVMDDPSEAQGPINGGRRPVIHISATGDIHIQDAALANDGE